jgi:CRISPR-associated exonuclease Cas4
MIAEPEYIPLAMINALAYCPRRFGYEFVQAEMIINDHVAEGVLRHQVVDLGGTNWTSDAIQQRRLYVWSERLHIAGFCDLVEERDGRRYPVEYKKGRLGRWKSDHAQLCAQAICLEERTGASIPEGAIFSFSERRREIVAFTMELRAEVERLAYEAHRIAHEAILPPATEQRAKCRDCSLQPLCLPEETERIALTKPVWNEE